MFNKKLLLVSMMKLLMEKDNSNLISGRAVEVNNLETNSMKGNADWNSRAQETQC